MTQVPRKSDASTNAAASDVASEKKTEETPRARFVRIVGGRMSNLVKSVERMPSPAVLRKMQFDADDIEKVKNGFNAMRDKVAKAMELAKSDTKIADDEPAFKFE